MVYFVENVKDVLPVIVWAPLSVDENRNREQTGLALARVATSGVYSTTIQSYLFGGVVRNAHSERTSR